MNRLARTVRLAAAALAGLVALAVSAGPALGDATVALSGGGELTTTVVARAGADGDHGIIVEPFDENGGRNGWRVRQHQFPRPQFSESDGDCDDDNLFNEVVCDGPRASAVVQAGDGNDTVAVSEMPGGREQLPRDSFTATAGDFTHRFEIPNPQGFWFGGTSLSCIELPVGADGTFGAPAGGPVEVNLGAGNDFVAAIASTFCSPGFAPAVGFLARLTATGGSGEDGLVGGPLADVLDGGAQADFVVGAGGADDLRGGTNVDELDGGPGNDSLDGGGGPDVLDGGEGPLVDRDRVLYDGRSNSVAVTIGAGANDGESGEGDDVRSSVERVIGGGAGDSLVGDGSQNILEGRSGADRLQGGGGADDLIGGFQNDTLLGGANADLLDGGFEADILDGGAGVDQLFGGPDGDGIDAREPAPPALSDEIRCGGGVDVLISDLEDPRSPDCEQIRQFALDDGPPGRALRQRLRVGPGGRVAVKVACPRKARTACRGVLTLRPAKGRRVLGRARYRVGLGKQRSVSLRARRRLPRRVAVEMEEQGVSEKGPRFSSRLLRVKR